LNNQLVRIVLRTGQPGQAPEQQVIIDYDINDYKAKTELTTQKLFTTVVASMRAYESLLMIERSRIGCQQNTGRRNQSLPDSFAARIRVGRAEPDQRHSRRRRRRRAVRGQGRCAGERPGPTVIAATGSITRT
jgi:hypothetical protein